MFRVLFELCGVCMETNQNRLIRIAWNTSTRHSKRTANAQWCCFRYSVHKHAQNGLYSACMTSNSCPLLHTHERVVDLHKIKAMPLKSRVWRLTSGKKIATGFSSVHPNYKALRDRNVPLRFWQTCYFIRWSCRLAYTNRMGSKSNPFECKTRTSRTKRDHRFLGGGYDSLFQGPFSSQLNQTSAPILQDHESYFADNKRQVAGKPHEELDLSHASSADTEKAETPHKTKLKSCTRHH